MPVQPAVMLVGGLATLTGMVLLPLGQVLAWVAWAFLERTFLAVQATAALPFSSIKVGHFDVIWLALYHMELLGTTRVNWDTWRNRIFSLWGPALALGVVRASGFWLWNLSATWPDGKTHVEFLDATAPATLIRSPHGARILIDGGTDPSVVLSALGERMPFWERSLDLVVLTHADDDHVAGLVAALERCNVRQVFQVGPPAKPTVAHLNMSFLFAGSAKPEEQKAVLTSGATSTATVALPPQNRQPEFPDAIGPHFVILFTGPNERGQPKPELVAAVSGTTILRTDERGTIEMITDGKTLQIKTER